MSSLRDIQEQFYDAVVGNDLALLPLLTARGIPPICRLEVYRNNAREGFCKALAATYPVVERLVGYGYFRQLAWGYARAHPSRSGNLDDFGARFGDYLARLLEGTQFQYLPDVARLEWSCQQVLLAEERIALEVSSLHEASAERCGQLRLLLHPACRLMASRYPILRIWLANQPGAAEDEIIDVASGGERVLLRRVGGAVELQALTPAEFLFIDALWRGETLSRAVDEAFSADPELALDRMLLRLFGLGLVVELQVS